ncbi:MipA/OmpV family protein [Sphingomonas parva]|uniref:MipA/OmpV family protein n=1 Tax=Sphingomonas parva TaxID=2555898 RepID=A0A4Y8ZM98_9SPHN|nr:MipA/OmpV family protein [Sphingomonas parva]TFI57120.1 MipA/OmpV family protein [Sphingomonas parva]
MSATATAGAPGADERQNERRRSSVTIGAGAAYVPTYEGSDDHRIVPAAAARGNVGGVEFFTRGLQLYVDVIPDRSEDGIELSLGPVVGVRRNRTGGSLKDDQVEALGKLKTAIEVGGFVGVSKTGVVTSNYDTLSARIAYVKDVGNAHESHVITPSINYATPLSPATLVGIGASLDLVGDGYADYYFSVPHSGAVASGLSPFSAEGGAKNWSLSIYAAQSLTGDLRRGAALFVGGSYSRLRGDFRRSPVVSEAGDAKQFLLAAGLGYTF